MNTFHIILLALMPVLLAASAVCSASETALFSLTQADRLRLRKSYPRTHAAVGRLQHHPGELLVTVLLSNVTVNTAIMVASTVIAGSLGPAGAAGVGLGVVFAVIIFGEIVPKSIAAAHRVPVARIVAMPMWLWMSLLGPVRVIATAYIVAPLVRVLHPPERRAHPLTVDDLSALLQVGAAQGVVDSQEQRLLDDVVRLSEVRIREVMTPRMAVSWLDSGATAADLLALAQRTGRSKFPVCQRELDETTLVGVVRLQTVLAALQRGETAASLRVRTLAEPPKFVPDRARLDQLLDHFRDTASDLALCVSESGDLTGMVTLDDVVRQLLGGSGTSGAEGHEQVRLKELGVWEVSGRLPLRDWAEYFEPGEIGLSSRVSTVAGLILARLGRVPKPGDEVVVGNVLLRVEAMTGRIIQRVTVRLRAGEAA